MQRCSIGRANGLKVLRKGKKFQMSKNRLEAFSDGVFAVIITIMVLDINYHKERTCMPLNRSFLCFSVTC